MDSDAEDESTLSMPSSRTGRRSLKEVAEDSPGALFLSGANEVRRLLCGRGGASSAQSDEIAADFVKYLNTVFHSEHPQSSMSPRNCHELRVLAEAMDALVSGNLEILADVLMQRFKSIQISTVDGHWGLAQNVEVHRSGDLGLTSLVEREAAAEQYLREHRVSEAAISRKVKGANP